MLYESTEQFKQWQFTFFFIFTFLDDYSSNSVENGMMGQDGLLESCSHKAIAECKMYT